jgi:WSC domain
VNTRILSTLVAIVCIGSVLVGSATAQTLAPVRKPVYVPEPLRPPPPRPNGAMACWADTGQALSPFGQVTDLPNRSLHDSFTWSERMTNDQCRATCGAQNELLAGTQSGAFCFCGNAYSAMPPAGNCGAQCPGYRGEICGGTGANSVSATTDYFNPVAVPATLPVNGWQCVFDMSAPGYRHFEVQRWEFAMTDAMTGNLIFNWTSTGGGVYQYGPPSGTELFRRFSFSGGAQVAFKRTVQNNGTRIFSRQGITGSANIRDVQLQTISGVPQLPVSDTSGTWSDYTVGLNLTAGTPVPATSTYSSDTYQWFSKPGSGAAGGITCNWTLAL